MSFDLVIFPHKEKKGWARLFESRLTLIPDSVKINQGVYFSTPKCCSTLMFGKTLH